MESSSKFLQFMNNMNQKKTIIDGDNTESFEDQIDINFFNKKLKGKNKKFGSKGLIEYNQWNLTADPSIPQHVSSNSNEITNVPVALDEDGSDYEDFDICSNQAVANVIAIDDSDDSDNVDEDCEKITLENVTEAELPAVESKTSNAFEIAAENIECKILVMDWIDNSVMKFVIRKFQPIAKIQKSIAEKHGLPLTSIDLEYDSVTLSDTDSPHSIGYVMGTKIEASRKTKNTTAPIQKQSQPDTNKINLRFRSAESRYPIALSLNPSDPMKIAMAIACERFELDPERVEFHFEGETIQFGDTAESLDMADDDVIDIEIR